MVPEPLSYESDQTNERLPIFRIWSVQVLFLSYRVRRPDASYSLACAILITGSIVCRCGAELCPASVTSTLLLPHHSTHLKRQATLPGPHSRSSSPPPPPPLISHLSH